MSECKENGCTQPVHVKKTEECRVHYFKRKYAERSANKNLLRRKSPQAQEEYLAGLWVQYGVEHLRSTS